MNLSLQDLRDEAAATEFPLETMEKVTYRMWSAVI